MASLLEKPALDIALIRQDFPVLSQRVHGHPLAYLDNAATTQKPMAVIQRMTDFYTQEYATVRRGVYSMSAQATQAYDAVRQQVAQFLNAGSPQEIVFTQGTTEAINLVAAGFVRPFLQPGDEIVISHLEHHSNIVPWQQVCLEKGAVLKVIPIDDTGTLLLEEYERLLTPKTRLVSVNHVSNALGTVNPIAQMIQMAHAKGIVVCIDGAQGVPHLPVDVQALDCDFYAFSGHKVYGPTGVGVLYGKRAHWDKMHPVQFGGDMIESVTFEKTTFAKPPHKFEAGTPPIVEVIGLGEALTYLQNLGWEAIHEVEQDLLKTATAKLVHLEGLRIIGTAAEKEAVISFVFEDVHPHDVGTILDQHGLAVRAGHHCAQPLMERFAVPATTRVSFAFYNTHEEIDRLIEALQVVIQVFR